MICLTRECQIKKKASQRQAIRSIKLYSDTSNPTGSVWLWSLGDFFVIKSLFWSLFLLSDSSIDLECLHQDKKYCRSAILPDSWLKIAKTLCNANAGKVHVDTLPTDGMPLCIAFFLGNKETCLQMQIQEKVLENHLSGSSQLIILPYQKISSLF